jgi:hypothetical protein
VIVIPATDPGKEWVELARDANPVQQEGNMKVSVSDREEEGGKRPKTHPPKEGIRR